MNTKLLQASDVEQLVQVIGLDNLMDSMLTRLEETFKSHDRLSSNIPIREGLQYNNPAIGMLEWMPAYIKDQDIAIKLVGYHPTNPGKRSLPSVLSTITLFDEQSGHLKGIVDGTFLTALRTGAMSALASRILAYPDSSIVGVIGAGAQAVTQIFALSRYFRIKQVICYDIDARAMNSLQDRIGFLDIPVRMVDRPALGTLVAESDIICTCTSEEPGRDPVFENVPTRSHLHINAVGSDFHGKTEIPVELLRRATVCPDFLAQAMHEGECQLMEPDAIGPDIVELVRNQSHLIHLQDGLTVFDSTGWALADFVVGNMAIQEASQHGIGLDLEIECIPSDPKNPFSFMKQGFSVDEGFQAAAASLFHNSSS